MYLWSAYRRCLVRYLKVSVNNCLTRVSSSARYACEALHEDDRERGAAEGLKGGGKGSFADDAKKRMHEEGAIYCH